MAIVRFQRASGTADLSAFLDWLNAHKEGTFLEDLTLTNTTTTQTNDTLTITDTDSSAQIISRTASNAVVFRYVGGTVEHEIKTSISSGSNAYVVGALLCSKGLLIHIYGNYNTERANDYYGICLTVDSSGKLAAVLSTSAATSSSSQISVWNTCAAGSTSVAQRECRPFYGSSLTSLAQISAQGIDNTLVLPYAFAAISTQLNAEALNSVLIDGAPFITNGAWYIRDADD